MRSGTSGRALTALTATIALLLLTTPSGAAIRFVATAGTDAGDCTSSSSPCATLPYTVSQALGGDTIQIAEASSAYSGPVLTGSTELTLSGGWSRDFGSRDIAANRTSITGASLLTAPGDALVLTIDGLTVKGAPGREPCIQANALAGGTITLNITNSAVGRDPILIRGPVTLTAADSSFRSSISADGGTVSLTRCTLTHSGLSLFGSVATVDRCTITKGTNGGISAVGGVDLTVTDSTISRNKLHGSGAGISFVASGALHLTRSVVSMNRGRRGFGGGIRLGGPMTATITDSIISGNRNDTGGGIMINAGLNIDLAVDIVNSVIAGNTATRGAAGGGVRVSALAGATISLRIANDTITGNRSSHGGGMVIEATSGTVTVDLANTIAWGNGSGSGGVDLVLREIANGEVSVDSHHNDVGEVVVFSGTLNDLGGNIDADPLFVQPFTDVHLTGTSPAIDAGTCVDAPASDVDGDPRPTGSDCDIGADEFVP